MRANLVRGFGGAVLAFLVTVPCMSVAHSQQKRKRTSRRVTHPSRPQPVESPQLPSEPSVVSTADEQPGAPRRTSAAQRQGANTQAENEQLRGTVRDLSTQVEKLNGELNQMKTDQRAMYDLERLTRAEQFAEGLRTQLREVTDKEAQYQERLAQIDYELQPEVIQMRAAGIGTLNPSAVRDSIQKSLERERDRVNKQLELLASSHTHLEAAVASAEAQVEKLRQRVEAADQQQPGSGADAANGANVGTSTNATPQPSPTPTPAQPPE
jgi:predicted  nucleic acid-binding Zn-ribbon protein